MKITKNNTKIETKNDRVIVKLHKTNIVAFNRDVICLNTGGYNTVTTRKRMNEVSKAYDLGYKVFQQEGKLYVNDGKEDIRFFEYCEIER
jgi:hypothetical protein